ncbi:hypothetical protein [Maridesulfovibrio frigidus]|uniref:hypothetical protein n=1 Tax=Maridesulfovibrio frigidus TaxID=340956 RepID=UPI0004E0CD93|nr:hypothetical protein [Maridesulfovibrio frigidus]
MVGISSLDSSLTSGVLDTSQAIQTKKVDDEELLNSKTQSGDTVSISAEAMALFSSKLEEYGAENPSELSDEQKEELKGTMDEFAIENGIDPTQVGGMPPPPEGGGEGASDSEGEGSSEGGGAGGATGGEAAQGSTGTSDMISDKEEEIEEKEEEIEELRAKVSEDEDAAEQLKTKQSELALLQSELALLEQQSA